MDINERIKIGLLAKYYGKLLTNKQLNVIKMYVDNNLSFAEVGDELGITRQAAKDMLDKAINLLKEYENKLQFNARDDKIKTILTNEKPEQAVIKILSILEE